MTLADFYADVADVIHESQDIDAVIRRGASRAAKWIERQYSFQYMRGTGYFQFGAVAGGVSVIDEIFAQGPTDVSISNPTVDGQVQVASLAAPFWTRLAVGDYIQFGLNVSGLYAGLADAYGQVVSVTPSTFGGSVTIGVLDDTGVGPGSSLQPATFSIKKLSGNPFTTAVSRDPGILAVGKRLKRIIGPIQICDADDKKKVLRKVIRLMADDVDPEDMNWSVDTVGSLPAGYFLLGQAKNVADQLVSSADFDDDEWILRFRPIPDKNYFAFIESYRYTLWPSDEEASHWLVDEAYGLLFARTMYEVGPALKDKDLLAEYTERIPQELMAAKLADTELEESDADDSMRYDPDHDSDR